MKRVAAVFLCVLVFLSLSAAFFSPGSSLYVLGENPEKIVAEQSYGGSNYKKLTVKEKYAYGKVEAAHENHETSFVLWEDMTKEEMNNVFTAVEFDFPERGCHGDEYYTSEEGKSFRYTLEYSLSFEECERRSEMCREEAAKLSAQAAQMTAYEKELFFHDELTERCSYSENTNSEIFTAYNALFAGKANCSGFTAAMSLLLNTAGVENTIALGEAKEKREGQEDSLHVWNVVTTEKGTYHTDVAWDATDEGEERLPCHIYFNLSDEEISKDHIIFPGYSGMCPKPRGSYYDVNKTSFASWGEKEKRAVGSLLGEELKKGGYAEFRFENPESYGEAADYLFNKSGVYTLLYEFCEDESKIPEELTYYVNDDRYTIFIKLS